MPEAAIYCPQCGSKARQQPEKCRQCGEVISEGSKFCPACGCAVNSSVATKSRSQKSKLYQILMVLSILCLVGGVILSSLLYSEQIKVKKAFARYEEDKQEYKEQVILYEIGYNDVKPLEPRKERAENSIKFSIMKTTLVSVLFWFLLLLNLLVFALTFTKKWDCATSAKIKLYIFTSLSSVLTIISFLYWYFNF